MPRFNQGAFVETDVASATTCNIASAAVLSTRVNITGTTTITSFGSAAKRWRLIRFAGVLTLTHNATSLILPGGASITTAAGDTCEAMSDASGNWRVYNYQRASGKAVVPSAFSDVTSKPTTLAGYGITDGATDAEVAAALDALVAAAPGALDTLDELAAALGDDANFAATVTTALGLKMAKSANLSDVGAAYTAFDNISVHGADIASAATLNLEAATGSLVDITGNTTITAVTLSNGHERWCRFTGTPQITVGASLIGNAGGGSVILKAGDMVVFRGYAAGVVRFWVIADFNKTAVVYRATWDASGNTNYAAGVAGDVYEIIVGGKVGGASGLDVRAKDLMLCIADTVSGDHATVGANWTVLQGVASLGDAAYKNTGTSAGTVASGERVPERPYQLGYYIKAADMASTADQAFTKVSTGPAFTNSKIERIVFVWRSGTFSGAPAGGIYSGAGKTGNAWVAASQTYGGLTGAGKMHLATPAAVVNTDYMTSTPILSLTTANGAALTADVFLFVIPLDLQP